MRQHARYGALGAGILAVGFIVGIAQQGHARGEKDYKGMVLKIAEAFKKGDKDAATKQAETFAKKMDHDDLEEVMALFKKRDQDGLGVGSKPGVVTPDGIEVKLEALRRAAPSPVTVKKEAEAIEEMAYVIAAIADIAQAKGPPRGKAKDWGQWSAEMRAGALKLAEAAKAKSANDLKNAAEKVNASCISCHGKYRSKS